MRLLLPVLALVLVSVVALTIVLAVLQARHVREDAAQSIERRTLALQSLFGVTRSIMLDRTHDAMRLLRSEGRRYGSANLGGRVTVGVQRLAEGRLRVAVSDTGIGIAAADLPKALAAFGQVESALSRKHEGTGLGLPLSKALVELHGGALEIESEAGVGTTVAVTFPSFRVLPRARAEAA